MNVNDMLHRRNMKMKDTLHKFKRLSTCSITDIEIWNQEQSDSTSSHLGFVNNSKNMILTLYPSEGQPCACVSQWEIEVNNNQRQCFVTHKVKNKTIKTFKANISLIDGNLIIWGKRKNDKNSTEHFEVKLHVVNKEYQSKYKLEGTLSCRTDAHSNFEQTHDVIYV